MNNRDMRGYFDDMFQLVYLKCKMVVINLQRDTNLLFCFFLNDASLTRAAYVVISMNHINIFNINLITEPLLKDNKACNV